MRVLSKFREIEPLVENLLQMLTWRVEFAPTDAWSTRVVGWNKEVCS